MKKKKKKVIESFISELEIIFSHNLQIKISKHKSLVSKQTIASVFQKIKTNHYIYIFIFKYACLFYYFVLFDYTCFVYFYGMTSFLAYLKFLCFQFYIHSCINKDIVILSYKLILYVKKKNLNNKDIQFAQSLVRNLCIEGSWLIYKMYNFICL